MADPVLPGAGWPGSRTAPGHSSFPLCCEGPKGPSQNLPTRDCGRRSPLPRPPLLAPGFSTLTPHGPWEGGNEEAGRWGEGGGPGHLRQGWRSLGSSRGRGSSAAGVAECSLSLRTEGSQIHSAWLPCFWKAGNGGMGGRDGMWGWGTFRTAQSPPAGSGPGLNGHSKAAAALPRRGCRTH